MGEAPHCRLHYPGLQREAGHPYCHPVQKQEPPISKWEALFFKNTHLIQHFLYKSATPKGYTFVLNNTATNHC